VEGSITLRNLNGYGADYATIKDEAFHLSVGWDIVKDIHKRYLKQKYSYVNIKKVKRIGIDEFAVRKGHVYKTIVVNLDTGHIIYVGDGKGSDSHIRQVPCRQTRA
jgi:hypothetical protein